MAGDWIPLDTTLPSKPEVVRIATAWGKSCDEIVGMLVRFWIWAQAHTADGRLPGMTTEMLSEVVHVPHRLFGELKKVGWLSEAESGLSIPNFERWLSRGAKRRLLDRDRKRATRQGSLSASCPQNVRKMSASNADKMRTTEEKRREENLLIPSPNGEGVGSPPTRSPPSASNEHLKRAMQALTEAWNRLPPPIPRISAWSDKRRKHLKARLADPTWLDRALQAIRRIPLCPFLLGQNDRGWTANIDWFLRPETLLKLEEGFYATAPSADREEPEPLSVTVHRLMQQREAASKPR